MVVQQKFTNQQSKFRYADMQIKNIEKCAFRKYRQLQNY